MSIARVPSGGKGCPEATAPPRFKLATLGRGKLDQWTTRDGIATPSPAIAMSSPISRT